MSQPFCKMSQQVSWGRILTSKLDKQKLLKIPLSRGFSRLSVSYILTTPSSLAAARTFCMSAAKNKEPFIYKRPHVLVLYSAWCIQSINMITWGERQAKGWHRITGVPIWDVLVVPDALVAFQQWGQRDPGTRICREGCMIHAMPENREGCYFVRWDTDSFFHIKTSL